MNQYLNNWGIWWTQTTGGFAKQHRKNFGSNATQWYLLWFWQQVVDRGLNTQSGGDPYMTLSGRFWRDRRDNVFARVFNAVVNFFFHADGPGDKDWSHHGEGSTEDLNLPNPQQGIAIGLTVIFWVGLIVAGVIYDF